jgi:hypothetical protein
MAATGVGIDKTASAPHTQPHEHAHNPTPPHEPLRAGALTSGCHPDVL